MVETTSLVRKETAEKPHLHSASDVQIDQTLNTVTIWWPKQSYS